MALKLSLEAERQILEVCHMETEINWKFIFLSLTAQKAKQVDPDEQKLHVELDNGGMFFIAFKGRIWPDQNGQIYFEIRPN